MAGHSHSKNIMHRKNGQDAKRGKLFSKLAKNIITAARNGSDPASNLSLRYAIDKAKQSSMPKDNIIRAIKKGSGEDGGTVPEEITYEGYGPAGTALIVKACTDNKNRTAPALRSTFSKYGGNLGTSGSVAWMFKAKSLFTVALEDSDEESLFEICLENGGEDVVQLEDCFEISGPPESFLNLVSAFETAGITTLSGEITYIPDNQVDILEEKAASTLLKLIEHLEDNEDVTSVHCNDNITYDILERVLNDG